MLKIFQLNCQDLYLFLDKYKGEDLETLFPPKWQLFTSSFFPNKPLDKLFALKEMIQSLDPDLLFLVEVGGTESLRNFNKYFLNNQYTVYCEASNSDRGIDTGYMVHKRLPYKVSLKNHVKPILSSGKKFSRGLLELRLSLNDKIVYINYLCHLKSKLNMNRVDFEGRGQRAAEVEYISNLYAKMSKKYESIPITISGDFNGVIYKEDTEEEFKDLIATGVKDIFEILDKPIEKRMSYCYFNFQGTRFPMQLDYFVIDPKFKSRIGSESTLIGFLPPYIDTFDLPDTLKEKRNLPSDHYALLVFLDI
jgi:hypothetical protein